MSLIHLSSLISFCTLLASVLYKHLYLLYASCSVKLTHIPVPFLYHSLPLESISCSFLPAHFLRVSSNTTSSSNYFCPKCFSSGYPWHHVYTTSLLSCHVSEIAQVLVRFFMYFGATWEQGLLHNMRIYNGAEHNVCV